MFKKYNLMNCYGSWNSNPLSNTGKTKQKYEYENYFSWKSWEKWILFQGVTLKISGYRVKSCCPELSIRKKEETCRNRVLCSTLSTHLKRPKLWTMISISYTVVLYSGGLATRWQGTLLGTSELFASSCDDISNSPLTKAKSWWI